MAVRVVKVEEAIGKVLAYDVTSVTPENMGAVLRRGDVIREEHIEPLKRSGHYYVYVVDGELSTSEEVHEDEAVLRVGELAAGEGVAVYARQGGKALLRASTDGLLVVDEEAVREINKEGEFALITRHSGIGVRRGEAVGIVDLIPFYVRREVIHRLEEALSGRKAVSVKPFRNLRVGLIVTGTEVYEGKVKDLASPVVHDKVRRYGGVVTRSTIVPDDKDVIASRIKEFLRDCDAVIVTGGMSVDPTDKTPAAIREVADEVVAYGIPVKPTTMSMVAYAAGKPIVGVSSGIIFFREWNVLDVLLPKVMAGFKWSRDELLALAVGGLSDVYLRRLKL
ncbi:MAG: molybdopterin-binding protein [Desulfurococcales archaeon]|nr:molybdopterin-binding protein [Desulfurococcales archaeon]